MMFFAVALGAAGGNFLYAAISKEHDWEKAIFVSFMQLVPIVVLAIALTK